MFNDKIMAKIAQYYPDVKIKFKDQSLFMKILSKIMFWNKDFMTGFITTIGSTIYFPSESFIGPHPITVFAALLHELVHVYDVHRLGKPLFSFLYLSPQILILLAPILYFLLGPLSLIFLICAFPTPSYFRMYFERRAYLVSLYIMNQLNIKFNYQIDLEEHKNSYLQDFKNGDYYFMWPFSNLDKNFDDGLAKIKAGQYPYDDKVFNILNDILAQY